MKFEDIADDFGEMLKLEGSFVYRYFKEKYGLVNTTYACKVLGVGRDKFRRLVKENNLEPEIIRGVVTNFDAHMYSLAKIYELKKEMNNK